MTTTQQTTLKAFDDPGRCEAISVRYNRRCKHRALDNFNFCAEHLQDYLDEVGRD